MDFKVEIEEPLNCDLYTIGLKTETKEEYSYDNNDTALMDKEEKEVDINFLRKIKVAELNFPVSDTGPNKEDLPNRLENSSSTSLIEVTQFCKESTKKQIFPTVSSVKGHILIHEDKGNNKIHEDKKPHKCEICGKSFTRIYHLRMHLIIHDGKKPHKCEVCGKSFSKISHLRAHLMIHEGKKPHKCEICGRSFTQASNLRGHLLIHEGKRPHKCEVCGKSFTHAPNLKIHILLHEGKKPHKCEVCGKSFTLASYLRLHLLTHKLRRDTN